MIFSWILLVLSLSLASLTKHSLDDDILGSGKKACRVSAKNRVSSSHSSNIAVEVEPKLSVSTNTPHVCDQTACACSAQSVERTCKDNFTGPFTCINGNEHQRGIKKYLSRHRKYMRTNFDNKSPYFYHYSNSFTDVSNFLFIIKIFELWQAKSNFDPEQSVPYYFYALFNQIKPLRKQKYLPYFSIPKQYERTLDDRFNYKTYYLLLVYFSFSYVENYDVNTFNDIVYCLFKDSPADEYLRPILLDEFIKLTGNHNLMTLQPNVISFIYISIPIISLIYSQLRNPSSTSNDNSKNVSMKETIDKMWNAIKIATNFHTNHNLSKFYQLEFFDIICEITQNLKEHKLQPNEKYIEKIKNLFNRLNELIEDFKFTQSEFHYRFLRNGTLEIFVGFITEMEIFNFLGFDLNIIKKCMREFEIFFRFQCAIFLYDFGIEFKRQDQIEGKNSIFQESRNVIEKFSLIDSILSIAETFENFNNQVQRDPFHCDEDTQEEVSLNMIPLDEEFACLLRNSNSSHQSQFNSSFVCNQIQQNPILCDEVTREKVTLDTISYDDEFALNQALNLFQQLNPNYSAKSPYILLRQELKNFAILDDSLAFFNENSNSDGHRKIINTFLQISAKNSKFQIVEKYCEHFESSGYKRNQFLDEIDAVRKSSNSSKENLISILSRDKEINDTYLKSISRINPNRKSKKIYIPLNQNEINFLAQKYLRFFEVKYS